MNSINFRSNWLLGVLGVMLTWIVAYQVPSFGVALASGTPLFADDFTGDSVGHGPAHWEVEDASDTSIRVVEEPGLASGRALHVVAGPSSPAKLLGVKTAPWQVGDEDATVISIDLKMRHVHGSHLAYVNAGTILIHWKVNAGGTLIYDNNYTVGALADGWNHIRIVANRDTSEAFVYLNDMEGKGFGPFPLRNQPETWAGAILRLAHAVGPDVTGEAFFGDVDISVVD